MGVIDVSGIGVGNGADEEVREGHITVVDGGPVEFWAAGVIEHVGG